MPTLFPIWDFPPKKGSQIKLLLDLENPLLNAAARAWIKALWSPLMVTNELNLTEEEGEEENTSDFHIMNDDYERDYKFPIYTSRKEQIS